MIRIALAQVNPTIGNLQGNVDLITRFIQRARAAGADLVAFPELAITGYPPDDLLLKQAFLSDSRRALEEVARSAEGIAAVVGCVEEQDGRLYSSAALMSRGQIEGFYRKHHLPNYGVFDERRFFSPGDEIVLGEIDGLAFGVTVCEDLWLKEGPHVACAAAGAELIVNINASPYHRGKGNERLQLLARRARRAGVYIAYVNMVGGADEIVFDGQSCVVAPDGSLIARARQFAEELLLFDLDPENLYRDEDKDQTAEVLTVRPFDGGSSRDETVVSVDLEWTPKPERMPLETYPAPSLGEDEEIYRALVLGLSDYMAKNGFRRALVGISGGIDSALTAAIAVDAVGSSNLLGISNPSDLTSAQGTQDSKQLATNLGFELVTLPIGPALNALRRTLADQFAGPEFSIADQNLQSRIRGLLWMYVSNHTGRMVLSTGNKSEMAVGYATLYGDMAGGFAVLKDVPKTTVYRLARWRNRVREVIPEAIIRRPPTAELAPGQLDTDALPPYETLDPILQAYVEQDLGVQEIADLGYEPALVERIAALVDRAEYKRRQAPPGIKITHRAFGRDRRVPITNHYRG